MREEMTSRRFRQPRADRPGGFTLIELILVMLLLTIIIGTAMPSLRGFLGWSRSRDAVAQILAMTQYARSKAVTDAKTYKFGADGTTCWLEVQEGETFTRVDNDELAAMLEVPAGAVVEFVPSLNNNTGVNISSSSSYGSQSTGAAQPVVTDGILFYPDGRTSPGVIRYTSPAGVPLLMGSPSPSESFRVMSSQEAQRL
jgi:prepilin-type N-terminal cleavage/methylation domain-containing protein